MTEENGPEPLAATCAVCGNAISFQLQSAHREMPVCGACGSCPRFCGLALAVSRAMWPGPDRPLARQSPRSDVIAIGISDDERLTRIFDEKFHYLNTRFHAEPHLDLCSAESCAKYRADLIICSDVLEHTVAPPALPLRHLFEMLKPGGTLVLSAPTYLCPSTIEWYGGAENIEIDEIKGGHQVRWRNRRGVEYVDSCPIFHGGPGSVLEMRVISHSELLFIARGMGFEGAALAFAPEWGYYWPIVRHLPFIEECADARVILLSRPADRKL